MSNKIASINMEGNRILGESKDSYLIRNRFHEVILQNVKKAAPNAFDDTQIPENIKSKQRERIHGPNKRIAGEELFKDFFTFAVIPFFSFSIAYTTKFSLIHHNCMKRQVVG